jgi:hypothetical protein
MASGSTCWSAQLDYRTITVLSVEQQEEISTALPEGAAVMFDSAVKRLACVFTLEATSARRATDQALRIGHRAVPDGVEAVGVRVLPAAEERVDADGNPSGVTVVGTVEAAALLGRGQTPAGRARRHAHWVPGPACYVEHREGLDTGCDRVFRPALPGRSSRPGGSIPRRRRRAPGTLAPTTQGGPKGVNRHRIAHTAQDLGLATWFGSGLMAAVGLEPALARLADPRIRAELASAVWGRWGPVHTAGIAAYLAGTARLAASTRPGWRSAATTAGLAGLALSASGYSAWQGLRATGEADITATASPSEPPATAEAEATRKLAHEAAGASPAPAASTTMLRTAGWTVPATTGCLIILSALDRT